MYNNNIEINKNIINNNNNYNNKYNNNDNNEMLLKGVKKAGIAKTENLMEKEEFKKNSQNEFKNKWYKKRMYKRMYEEIDKGLILEMVGAK